MFGTGETERNAASLLRLSSSRDSNLEEESHPQQPGGASASGGDGRDLSLSACESQEHVSSLNITLRTGFGGTGSPHVHTHSQVTGRDTCPLSLPLSWEFPFRFALEDLWKRLTGL